MKEQSEAIVARDISILVGHKVEHGFNQSRVINFEWRNIAF
jgi:hypothetical protein